MQQIDALFIGSSTKDLLMQVEEPPASDHRIAASSFTVACGGVSATAAAAYQSLGGSTGVITAVGDDETGEFIRKDLKKLYLDYLKLYTYSNRPSSLSMVQVETNGKRCLTCFGGCIDSLTFDEIDKELLHRIRILHLGVLAPETMFELCRYCKEHTSAKISIDGGNLPRSVAERVLPFADFFIPDHKTAMATLGLDPESACRWYVEHGARVSCVTAAEKGSWAYDGYRLFHADTIPVQILDTTGAGDNFHGAFLYCINHGWGLEFALRFSNIFASLTCRELGGRAAIPSRETVLALYRSENSHSCSPASR